MLDYLQKFRKIVENKFVSGEQNNSMLFFVKIAKFCRLEQNEALNEIKSMWSGKFDRSDETSFKNAWKNRKTDPDKFIDEKKEDEKKDEVKIENIPFRKWVDSVKVEPAAFDERDTSILKWWYKPSDLICITKDQYDSCDMMSDCFELMNQEQPMKKYQFMSIATFKEMNGKRNQQNIKEMRLVLLECDGLPVDVQKKMFFSMIEAGLPVKSIIFSGGKSVHCILKIHPISSIEKYKEYCECIYNELNKLHPKMIDTANKDGIRYTRAPFGFRLDKGKIQDLLWCDEIEMENEKFEFEDTLEQVKRFVGMFVGQVKNAEKVVDVNGNLKYEYMSSLKEDKKIIDIFTSQGALFVKFKDMELQRIGRTDLWNSTNYLIDKSVADILLEGKPEKRKILTMDDFYFKTKDIVYDISKAEDPDDRTYNMFEAGFYKECVGMKVEKMPSEFDKLLDNLADKKCKKWLINHLACYFKLLLTGFNHPLRGKMHTLETIPVFYGKSGTGKNTLIDIIGRAICKIGSTDISVADLNGDFNEFFKAGLINVNEAAKGKGERRASKEALKRFSDRWQELNQKFMPKIQLFNGAYKCISANESDYGVLDIDQFDRRYQYITGGGQLNGKIHNVCDMKLLYRQEKEFIAYLIGLDCNFDEAEQVFDNEAKIIDKKESMSNPEKIAYWVWENSDSLEMDWISPRIALRKFNDLNMTRMEVSLVILGRCMQKYFSEKIQWGKKGIAEDEIKRGERAFSFRSKIMDVGLDEDHLI